MDDCLIKCSHWILILFIFQYYKLNRRIFKWIYFDELHNHTVHISVNACEAKFTDQENTACKELCTGKNMHACRMWSSS